MSKTKEPHMEYPPGWIVQNCFKVGPRELTLEPRSYFKVSGEVGTWRFLHYIINTNTDARWIDAVNEYGFRSFRPERVTRVVPKPKDPNDS